MLATLNKDCVKPCGYHMPFWIHLLRPGMNTINNLRFAIMFACDELDLVIDWHCTKRN